MLSGDFFDGFLGAFVLRVGARGKGKGEKTEENHPPKKRRKKKRSGRKPGTLIINFSGHGQGTGKIIN